MAQSFEFLERCFLVDIFLIFLLIIDCLLLLEKFLMRILLTGGSGMVGSNIKEHKSSTHYSVLSPSRQELDLTNRQHIRNYLMNNNPTCIIHAAGLVGGIHANMANPSRFLILSNS